MIAYTSQQPKGFLNISVCACADADQNLDLQNHVNSGDRMLKQLTTTHNMIHACIMGTMHHLSDAPAELEPGADGDSLSGCGSSQSAYVITDCRAVWGNFFSRVEHLMNDEAGHLLELELQCDGSIAKFTSWSAYMLRRSTHGEDGTLQLPGPVPYT